MKSRSGGRRPCRAEGPELRVHVSEPHLILSIKEFTMNTFMYRLLAFTTLLGGPALALAAGACCIAGASCCMDFLPCCWE